MISTAIKTTMFPEQCDQEIFDEFVKQIQNIYISEPTTPKLTKKKKDKPMRQKKNPEFQRTQPIKFDFPTEMVRISLQDKLKDHSLEITANEMRELIGAVVSKLIDLDM